MIANCTLLTKLKLREGELLSTKPRARTQNQVLALSTVLFSFTERLPLFTILSYSGVNLVKCHAQYLGGASDSCFDF